MFSYFIDLCTDVFGPEYNITYLEAAVARTNAFYGGADNYRGTNVIATQGSIDPVNALGIKESNDPSVITYMVEGASHCQGKKIEIFAIRNYIFFRYD